MIAAADLRRIDLFDDLDDAGLEAFAAVAQERSFGPDACVGDQGDNPEGVMLLLDGTLLAEVVENGRADVVSRQYAPTWINAVAVLTGASLGVRMTSETPCRIGLIGREDFRTLAFAHPAVHDRVMRQVAPVMSRITAVQASSAASEVSSNRSIRRRSAAVIMRRRGTGGRA